ncbi:helix-turn-helix transcriptional regulator [Caballeronia sp. KNU42]
MPRTFQRPFPSVERQIRALAERLKLARMRRGMSTSLFAERLGVSRDTLSRLEKGDGNIAISTYMRALRILGLDADMDAVARDDELGRKLQDLNLPSRISPGKRTRAKKPAVLSEQPASETPPEES